MVWKEPFFKRVPSKWFAILLTILFKKNKIILRRELVDYVRKTVCRNCHGQ